MARGARLARHRTVIETANRPGLSIVAGITGLRCRNMAGSLPPGSVTIMATDARTNDLAMVHTRGGQPGGIVMTGFTTIRAGDVIRRFTGFNYAIVALDARLPANRLMIKRRNNPGIDVMAGVTLGRGRNMACTLARSGHPIVTR